MSTPSSSIQRRSLCAGATYRSVLSGRIEPTGGGGAGGITAAGCDGAGGSFGIQTHTYGVGTPSPGGLVHVRRGSRHHHAGADDRPREHEVRAERQDAVPRRNRPRRPELPRIDGSRKRSRLKARRTESQPRPEPEPRRDSDERPRCGASFGPRRSRPPALTTPAQALAAPDST